MASVPREDTFLFEVERVRAEVKFKFARCRQLLEKREEELLSQLDQLVERYKGYAVQKQIDELNEMKQMQLAAVKRNENKDFVLRKVSEYDERMRELRETFGREKSRMWRVSLEWDGAFETHLKKMGEINLSSRPNYIGKGLPLLVACKHGTEKCRVPGKFFYPRTIFIQSETNNAFICDLGNNRVQVFNKSFEFLFDFSENMSGPYGICICGSNAHVTQYSGHCLNVYSCEGKFLKSVGKYGNKELEFDRPKGIDILAEIVYVCDFGNNRLQSLNLDLTPNSLILDVPEPRDVKLTADQIVVLTGGDHCIRSYNHSHQLIKEMISSGKGGQVVAPYLFCIDRERNILIIDNTGHSVSVFTGNGELLHKFGRKGTERGELLNPLGIALDSDHRIIIASMNPENCVQLF